MISRRSFLRTTGLAGTAAVAAFTNESPSLVQAASARVGNTPPGEVAADESYWREIQQAFTLDRTIINLNNGGCCPSPRVVHEALKRYLDISNQAPVYHMWQILEPNIETVRRRLAAEFGCDAEELAITRNASEALQIAQLGIALRPGDEVITTNQDYGRMLDTWEQRVRRDKITLTKVSFPVPPKSMDVLAERLVSAITPATKVLHFCHITNLTGQIFPVKTICEQARRRGIKTIVDGAHAFAHFPFKASDLGCDYYGTSLHKWLLAPIGTGFLYVRRENNPDKRVIVVDCDLRRSSVVTSLGVPATGGTIDEYLAGAKTIEEIIGRDEQSGLYYIPARAHTPNSAEILDSKAMHSFVQALTEQFELVFLDTPPLMAVTDARIAAKLADYVIFLVRWEQTARELAVNALKLLRDTNKSIGVVLSQVNVRRHAKYGYGDYGTYYSKYRNYYTN
jgi:selenocysteine lyase/cysteine desulfurase